MATAKDAPRKRVVFLHPDLGIGGAERLVVDAAVGLQSQGCKVTIFTSHCDPGHCFTEARDGTLDVRVRGKSIVPPTIHGRFAILCAILRQLHLILSIAVFSKELKDLQPTHFFVDQLSAGVPLLRLLSRDSRILFYCHFPDKLLAQKGTGLLRQVKRLYRVPFNLIEAWSTGCSDDIVVNSKFTASMVKAEFPSLADRPFKVVYPCVDTDVLSDHEVTTEKLSPAIKTVLLSINRFEKKKGVDLAIRAYSTISASQREASVLVLAGGYDPRVAENVTYLEELRRLAASQGLKHTTLRQQSTLPAIEGDLDVLFLPSISDKVKQALLDTSTLLMYTPENEHFGIVPLEAMLNEVPVLAAQSGGPLETIVDGQTGWLRDVTDVDAWAKVLRDVIEMQTSNKAKLADMGKTGKARVQKLFSKKQMALQLSNVLDELADKTRPEVFGVTLQLIGLILAGLALAAGLAVARILR